MKKFILAGIFLCTLLAGCEQQQSAVQKEQNVAGEVEKNEETTASNIQGSPINKEVQSRYAMKMNAVEGETYTLHVFANDEKHEVQAETWAGAMAGDDIYTGTYELALQSTDSKLYLQEAKIGNFRFNTSQTSGFVSEGSPDFFVATERQASNISIGKAFYINKGKVMPVKINGSNDEIVMTENYFKALESGKFMVANYNNGNGVWHITTFQVDLETGNASVVDNKELSLEEGNKYLQENFN